MEHNRVLQLAKEAQAQGASRICLGVAWREVRDGRRFDQILEMVKSITALGLEVCCTLGMLKEHHAQRLKEAGLYSYNHNLDSSEKFYKTIITTRNYQDRLQTLDVVNKIGLGVCCGAILGMGETMEDRLEFLLTLSRREPPPDSVPINRLFAVSGTPLENQPLLPIWEMIRMIATTRIVLPKAMVRLSCGRLEMSIEQQALCFLSGANSIHAGEKLLTTPTSPWEVDHAMFKLLGLTPLPAFVSENL
jgi:biotin synthase